MEDQLVRRQCPHQGAQAVRVVQREIRMVGQVDHLIHRVGPHRQRLGGEPLVEHQAIVAIARVKVRKGSVALGRIDVRENTQGALPVGHIVGGVELVLGDAGHVSRLARHHEAERDVAQPPRALGLRGLLETVGAAAIIGVAPCIGEGSAEIAAQRLACLMDRLRIDHQHLIADKTFGRQQHRLADIRAVEHRIGQRALHRLDHRAMIRLAARDAAHQRVEHQLLHRLVPGEGIVIMRGQEGEIGRGAIRFDDDGRRKAAVDRQHRSIANALEGHVEPVILQHHQPFAAEAARGLFAEQVEPQRDRHRRLFGLTRCRRHALFQGQMRAPASRLMRQRRLDARGAGLAVPETEARQIDPARLLHRQHEILAGRGGAVVAREIEVGAGPETLRPQHRVEHPDDFRALVIDGRGVEVRDLDIAFGPDRMRERPRILGELRRAKPAHILDPLDRGRTLIG